MYDRIFNLPLEEANSAFVFGPRGTGKTTWLKEKLPQALYFDLLDDETYTEFLARPHRLADKIPQDYANWVIIDEVQKVPALLNEVHRLIEQNHIKFILTGSSARSLRRKGVNLLAGRALIYHMHPLTTIELGSDFDFGHALDYGMLPMAIHHTQVEKYLSSYIKTYLREEILQEGLARNIALFTRFLETASFSQGEVLSYTNIAREIASNRHTVSNFFDILEDLLIAYRLPVFTKKAKRDMIAHPKFYFFDVGVYRSIRPKGLLDTDSDQEGAALETLFLQEARAINDYFDLKYDFFYWRTTTQIEVDFVIYGKNGLFAFEIKRKANLTHKDFKGLSLFKQDYPLAQCYMLYGGSKTYYENDIKVLPYVEALKNVMQILSRSEQH